MANAKDQSITLSSALLAPINSLFEAQVQSARSFLSFILQLGFKERVTERDIIEEEERLEAEGHLDDAAREKIQTLRNLIEYNKLRNKKDRSAQEEKNLKKLDASLEDLDMKDDVYMLRFQYEDGEGYEHTIKIPALALVPVQPLAIESATFDFYMNVESSFEKYETKQKSRTVRKSPWEFIEPKRIKGNIGNKDNEKRTAGINIQVKLASAPVPAGLNNLLTSLTQSSRIED